MITNRQAFKAIKRIQATYLIELREALQIWHKMGLGAKMTWVAP